MRMTQFSRRRAPLCALVLMALFLGVVPAHATHAAGGLHQPRRHAPAAGPKSYYLSLGDSLAFGYQPFPPIRQGFGFFDFLAASLERINPDVQPVNLGCPGESSTTFINGGCPSANAVRYQGSQLNAALAFLKAHQGQVRPIT